MGLSPVSIDWLRARVEILDLSNTALDEPFFADTIDRIRREQPCDGPQFVDLPSFVLQAQNQTLAPDLLVFHVGRCGSTLLTNMLVGGGDFISINEPEIVNQLVAAWLASSAEQRPQIELVTGTIIGALMFSTETPRLRVLKLAAWNVQMAAALLKLFPESAAVFLFRSPFETVASCLHTPPAWFETILSSDSALVRYFPSIAEVPVAQRTSPAVLFSHAWRSAVDAALSVPGSRLVLLLYDDLIRNTAGTLEGLLCNLKVPAEDGVIQQMSSCLKTYSKDPEGREVFDPDGKHRRRDLTPVEHDEVEAATGDCWRKLQRRAV